ncbi:hypothetical protein PYW07_008789 [Mythimna separata]|uniref:Uncharacterized protein n=1 Tax=Mythimna separata TaxID=271217 RepID=A0AAD7YAC9_MYTSE|nr:hypothetical protein PYW07_008789 [Mythimna separata]
MGLSQLVKQATRVPDIAGHTANCLDLLLTTDPDRCIVTISSPLGTSDHCMVKSVASFSPPDCDSRGERRMWRYQSADWDEMWHFFASYPWQQVCFSSENPSSCAEAISDVVCRSKRTSVSPHCLRWFGQMEHWLIRREKKQVTLYLSSPINHVLTLALLVHRLYLTAAPRCTRNGGGAGRPAGRATPPPRRTSRGVRTPSGAADARRARARALPAPARAVALHYYLH